MNQYVLSLSYGKDSLACIHVIKDILKWQLDRIVTVDVWFDDDTPSDLPEVWDFKKKMDEVIKEKYGIAVEHLCASRGGQRRHSQDASSTDTENAVNGQDITGDSQPQSVSGATQDLKSMCCKEKLTYKDMFYSTVKPKESTIQKWGGQTSERCLDSQCTLNNGVSPDSRDKSSTRIFGWLNAGLQCTATKALKTEPIRISLHNRRRMVSPTQRGCLQTSFLTRRHRSQ